METSFLTFVVDTNVLVYSLLRTDPFSEEARKFLERGDELAAPDVWRPEFINALWVCGRTGRVTTDQVYRFLPLAENIVSQTIQSHNLWADAFHLAFEVNHPPYDTLFVALARRYDTHLVTYDRRLLELFPTVAKKPSELVTE